ncbi:DUF2490 domain-containing protein [Tamlana crocina]|uniref:DUF2490 domain-containing protein n=1 Tax=Tamlana crocina TaxID=393006 RepID=A0ABX1DEC7_9FLAO|nr:DUF2490 domain-containing protein [Tamlana crocina]
MNIQHFRFSLFLLAMLWGCNSANAQKSFSSLGESAIGINHRISKNYNLNITLRSRYFLYNNDHFGYEQQQFDIYHLSSFKWKQNKTFGLGIYYRNRDWFDSGSDELRFMQQFVRKKQLVTAKVSHRFRAEQRLFEASTIYRQRYKFGMDFPLKPVKSKSRKTYLSTALEVLWSLSKQIRGETDIRVTAQMVWPILNKLGLKAGLEHRMEAFNLKAKHYLFVLTSVSLKI